MRFLLNSYISMTIVRFTKYLPTVYASRFDVQLSVDVCGSSVSARSTWNRWNGAPVHQQNRKRGSTVLEPLVSRGKDREYRVVSALPLYTGKVCAQSSEKDSLTVSRGLRENSGAFVCWLPSASFGQILLLDGCEPTGTYGSNHERRDGKRKIKKLEDIKKYVEYTF